MEIKYLNARQPLLVPFGPLVCFCLFLCLNGFTAPAAVSAGTLSGTPPAESLPADRQPVFVQRLEWTPVSYAKEYRVTIEKRLADGSYEVTESFATTDTAVERSLAAGQYRYRVQVVNLFDKLEEAPPWMDFEVLQAVLPVLEMPPSPVNFARQEELTVTGRDLSPQAVIRLRNTQTGALLSLPAQVSADGAKLKLNLSGLKKKQQGPYELSVENPGGLVSRLPLFFAYKPRVWSLSASYAPLVFPTAGSIGRAFFNQTFAPNGGALTLEWLPVDAGRGRLGFDLFVQAAYIFTDHPGGVLGELYDAVRVSMFLSTAHARLVYEWPLIKDRFYLMVKAGGGVTALLDFKAAEDDGKLLASPFNGLQPSFSASLALRYVFAPGAFLAAGADYIYLLDKKLDPHYLVPHLSFGWKW